ncbi:MAG: trigger factor [Lachnospiraceae bacterium]
MSVQVEKLEKSMVKLTIEVSAEKFEEGMQAAYLKNRGKIAIPGFRKGKVPRAIIEKYYGAGFFYEDAANNVMPEAYDQALTEAGIEPTSNPMDVNVVSIAKGEPMVFTVSVAVKPEVTLGQYKDLEYVAEPVVVTEEDINAELKKVQEQNSRTITVEDRPVQDGDIVNIDYAGSVDGVAFEGGTAQGYDLTIGSHSFIDNFEEQLIGANTGDNLDINVTFPAEYHAADLAGKPALFKVTINAIKVKELPELDDDFASDISDFDTLEEYKADLEKTIRDRKEKEAETAKENALVDMAVANASFEIADAMIEAEAQQMVRNFGQRLQQQGMSLEQYAQYLNVTVKDLTEQMKPNAEKNISNRIVLEAIAAAENIEVTEEEINEEVDKMASAYGVDADTVKSAMGVENIKSDLAVSKAVKCITAK